MENKHVLPSAALALLSLFLWLAGVRAAHRTALRADVIPVRFISEGISPADLVRYENMLASDGAEDIPSAVLWRELPVKNASFALKDADELSCKVTQVFGDAANAGFTIINGWFPVKGDTLSCVISERLANDIWNSSDAVGKIIYLDGRAYNITGVSNESDRHILIQTDERNVESFNKMSLRFPHYGGKPDAEAYLRKAGFPEANILDLPVLDYLLRLLAYIPALCAALIVLIRIMSNARTMIKRGALQIISAAALIIASIWIITGTEPPPPRLLPGAWSDFNFYGTLMAEWINDVGIWLYSPSATDMAIISGVLSSVLLILLSITFMTVVLIKPRVASFKTLIICCTVSTAAMCLWTILTGDNLSPGLGLAPILLIFTDYGLNIAW